MPHPASGGRRRAEHRPSRHPSSALPNSRTSRATRLNPARRLRAAPRVIKRKMPKWHVKRAHHATWPQPQRPAAYTALPP